MIFQSVTQAARWKKLEYDEFGVEPHSRTQSLVGVWERGPGGSGDTGFEVISESFPIQR